MADAGATRDGDWQCPNMSCINHVKFPATFVYGSKVNCPKCGTGKTAKTAGDWCCPNPQCVNHTNTVYGSKASCSKCGMPRPPLGAPGVGGKGGGGLQTPLPPMMGHPLIAGCGPKGGPGPTRPGDWHCANPDCKNHTANFIYGSKSSCPLCGFEKPAEPAPAFAPQDQQPIYQQQPFRISSFLQQQQRPMYQQMPGYPQQQIYYQQPQPPPYAPPQRGGGKGGGKVGHPGDWHCPNPSCKNHTTDVCYASKTECPLCHTPKPDESGPSARSSVARHDGDWQCPDPSCKNHTNFVYASKAACTICGQPNPWASGTARGRSRSPRRGMAK
mmetsp:Transcript_104178/g.222630  ORF Transcript_104178/g.222630 Transcript_104178/m.222630 type:complete len:329 (+) Transcript_104178:59-1045(+)